MLIHACRSRTTRLAQTLIDWLLTTIPPESRRTRANKRSVRIVANPAVQAHPTHRAFVHIVLAQRPRVTGSRAVAPETVHLIDALAVVQAGFRGTIVGVDLTAGARESRLAHALHGTGRRGHPAGGVVQAVLPALRIEIHLRFAMRSAVVRQTRAAVVAARVLLAEPIVFARVLHVQQTRRSGVHFAVLSRVSGRALAFVAGKEHLEFQLVYQYIYIRN